MKFAKPPDGAPAYMMRRWEAQEANGCVQPDGTPVPDDETEQTQKPPLTLANPWVQPDGTYETCETYETYETEQTQKRPLTRLILALVTAIVFIGGSFWIGSKDSSSDNSAANLEREFFRERDRASVAIGGLTAARERENVALTEALENKQIANSKQRELKQALDESEARSEALARELASARENDVAARNIAAAPYPRTRCQQMELKQALDESEKRAPSSVKMPHRSKLPMPGRWN